MHDRRSSKGLQGSGTGDKENLKASQHRSRNSINHYRCQADRDSWEREPFSEKSGARDGKDRWIGLSLRDEFQISKADDALRQATMEEWIPERWGKEGYGVGKKAKADDTEG